MFDTMQAVGGKLSYNVAATQPDRRLVPVATSGIGPLGTFGSSVMN